MTMTTREAVDTTKDVFEDKARLVSVALHNLHQRKSEDFLHNPKLRERTDILADTSRQLDQAIKAVESLNQQLSNGDVPTPKS